MARRTERGNGARSGRSDEVEWQCWKDMPCVERKPFL